MGVSYNGGKDKAGIMTDTFFETMERYREAFGDYFPTEGHTLSMADMIRVMEECIEAGEPYREPPLLDEGGLPIDY